ncbi:RNA polymerase sigma-70 factor, ECF subfamily [Chitinophaga ginsengisegetis]|uniref:RNA polymerase sigma-70 factor, ECF subfamily n=1 Tax=Chitinophaga ginsengisegetis TaxID=393003 RepID=A0A1T5NC36_9BACT|nr:sigma-70 family RNA polymerase sigma factor [Chitinophaga ginsengisegetis]MDR6568273.1 RNA polymerase sigma-70 factor (ECF subfamily) [Chitinophaga ginsengisegetis]MDR6648496.1 RNA polymerase sigma-70 factor (ECF subfamily) [Chitinophaga ginsengisegetis]MDR6654354.1 RNA polymerase sigma-70 factor (ECF subfamily) [Chitinophaga ginsengisegetis]SKC97749.1 RNA polymerase sigma-70 factor, ECF subfamily [Chitinophaga ginsengisegetis]
MSGIKSIEETELLSLIEKGNRRAFELVYKDYFGQLSYYAFKIIDNPEESKDIASDILVQIIARPKQFKSLSHLKNYLFLATRHACLHFLGQQKREQFTFDELHNLADEADWESDVERVRASVVSAVYEQLNALPKGCAEVFRLIYFEGKSITEVAEQLEISTKTVLNQKQTAAKLLKAALLKKGLLALFVVFFGEL